ncbi:MAG: Ig-like domain-containing protein [Candidatus Margulisiibacteriota bacterium]
MVVSPDTATLSTGNTQQFRVSGLVRSSSIATQEVSWAIVGGVGTIDATGLFTATAEGTGTVEARVGSLTGRARVTVTGQGQQVSRGRTISGKVKNILSTNEVISSAVILAGGKTAISGSDGTYQLAGVSSTVDAISAAVPGFVSTTIQSTSESINIPMGYPVQSSSYSYPSESTLVKGKLVDGSGNPISSTSLRIILWDPSYTISSGGYTGSDGSFSLSVSIPKNIASLTGYIMVVKDISGTYKGVINKITLIRGVTLEVGDIVVDGEVATLTGTVTPSSGFSLYSVTCGIQITPANRLDLSTAYSWSGISGNQYTIRVPVTPAGEKYYICARGVKGNDSVSKYLTDLVVGAGTQTYNLDLPQGIVLTYPASEQSGISTTPKFEWLSLGSSYGYLVVVGNNFGVKWWGFTKGTSLTYPSFPVGSAGENTNLQNGQMYYVWVAGYENPNLDINDLKAEDINNATAYSQMASIPFSVGSASGTSVRSYDVRGKEEFDKRVREFLKGLRGGEWGDD